MGRANSISLLCDITKIVNTTTSPEQVFSDVARECARAMDLDEIVIYSYDVSEESMIQKAISGHRSAEFANDLLFFDKSRDRKPESIVLDPDNSHSQISIPIIWKGRLYGLIDSRFGTQAFDIDSNELLFTIIAFLLTPKFIEFQKPKREFRENNKYYQRLIELLEKDKLYRDESICLSDISKRLNVSPSYLSQIINKLGNKSFSTLINQYRIREVIAAFESGEHMKYSILAIAFDAGFSSKSTFNAVFKNELGCSPSKYIQEYV